MRLRAKGFTLIEVIVALSIFSLLLAGMMLSMRGLAQTAGRLEAQTLENDDLRLVDGFMQRIVGSAVARSYVDPKTQEPTAWFVGSAQMLSWVGNMPARHGLGGISHFRLYLLQTESGHQLRLQILPFRGDAVAPDWAVAESRILLDMVDAFRIDYLGMYEADWLAQWFDPFALPAFVSLSFTVRGRVWPPIIIPLSNAQLRPGIQLAPALPVVLPR